MWLTVGVLVELACNLTPELKAERRIVGCVVHQREAAELQAPRLRDERSVDHLFDHVPSDNDEASNGRVAPSQIRWRGRVVLIRQIAATEGTLFPCTRRHASSWCNRFFPNTEAP